MGVYGGLKPEDWRRWGQFTTFKANAPELLAKSDRNKHDPRKRPELLGLVAVNCGKRHNKGRNKAQQTKSESQQFRASPGACAQQQRNKSATRGVKLLRSPPY